MQLKIDKNFGGDSFHLRPSLSGALLVTFVAQDKSNAPTASGNETNYELGIMNYELNRPFRQQQTHQ